METQINQILSQSTTKTAKIQQLILLGLTRKRIAELVANGNYGFVQNVYAKMRAEGTINQTNEIQIDQSFTRKFGIEFEAYNVEMQVLKQALNRAGIECEVEGYNHNTRPHWKLVTDGSLTGTNTFELVSPILEGENGINEVEKVCRVLENCRAKVNKTCGTHIHFDASQIKLAEWKRIYINYARLETTIDNFMPESRRNNRFCEGFRNITNFETRINDCTSLTQIENIFGRSRYFKINPMSYSRHKTIEFRQHSGTIEFDKISNWIKFLNNLVTTSKTRLFENPTLETLSDFNNETITNFFKSRTQKFARQ